MILWRKAVRSIWRGKKAYLACIALLVIGVMMYVSFHMLYENLLAARDAMYREQRFADVFAQVRALPLRESPRLERVEGVARAQATLTADCRVTGLRDDKLVALRINSFDPGEGERVNDFLIMEGGLPSAGEILVGQPFMKANELEVGDSLNLVMEGRETTLHISGAVLSPEYVYAIPDSGQLMPDNAAFGFSFMPYGDMAGLLGREGEASNIAFLLEDGVTYESIRPQLEDAIAPYGATALYHADDQPSNSMLKQEIDSIGSMATSLSMVFVLMAVIILYIMLKRVVEQERSQIGTLKAFGFSDTAILGHYIMYGLVVGLPGGLIGIWAGLGMAGSFTVIYLDFFNLPALTAQVNPVTVTMGFLIALLAGAAGALMGARSIIKLLPGAAMRPPAPPIVRGDLVARIPLLRHILAGSGRMAVRNISRSKFRSLFTIVGIAFSFSLIAFMGSFDYMMDAMLIDQYTKVEVYDMKISLREPKPLRAAVESAWGVRSIGAAEGIMELPVELRNGHLKKIISVTALEKNSRLYRIHDSELGRDLPPPDYGIILSSSLAEKLEANRGDVLTLTTAYTGDEEFSLPVAGIVNHNLGQGAYMELGNLCDLLSQPKLANALLIRTDDPEYVTDELLEAENILSIMDVEAAKNVYVEMLDTYISMIWIMQAASMGVAFAIIVNTASISLSERAREYSTLRVIGMTPTAIGGIMAFEYRILTIVGMGLGIPLTWGLKAAMNDVMNNDMFSMPSHTPLASIITAMAACALTVELCNLLAIRNIGRFDMVDVLKERE